MAFVQACDNPSALAMQLITTVLYQNQWGPCPTNGILIELEIRPKFGVLSFKKCSTDHKEILHTSRQLHCRVVCKISLWSVGCILNQSIANFGRISDSIEIWSVGWVHDLAMT